MDEIVGVTLDYYNKNAKKFYSDTSEIVFSTHQNLFLSCLPQHAHILDFGCGSGRDSKAFISHGLTVDAIDGSEELCRIASALIGKSVECRKFQELDAVKRYDGIWACASILHLPSVELEDVMMRIYRALKPEGVLYTSFKYGEFEGMRNGRYFHDMNENRMQALLKKLAVFKTEKMWISSDVRIGREDEKWLNIILRAIKQK